MQHPFQPYQGPIPEQHDTTSEQKTKRPDIHGTTLYVKLSESPFSGLYLTAKADAVLGFEPRPGVSLYCAIDSNMWRWLETGYASVAEIVAGHCGWAFMVDERTVPAVRLWIPMSQIPLQWLAGLGV